MKKLFLIISILTTALGFSQNDSLFEQGNKLYNDGDYAEAIEKYETILNNGEHSAELYFNLGNANYKLNNIAPSIFYYEKALQLAPNDKEIQNNIAFAKNMTIDAIDVIPEVGLSKIVNGATRSLGFDGWAYIAVVGMLIFVVLYLYYYFSYSTVTKRITFVASFAFLGITLIALTFAFHRYELQKRDQPAIVFAEESQVKSEPNLRSEEAFRLHEGTKVQVLDTLNDWKKIKLTDGKTGWISSNDIRLLKTF
ncbi:tetratricopeptide repeat protein [Mangrovimonas sp. TPBH4]|uniref:tetratricopeptide repeat protein n=1 Tax=Mangrovimonas sp. TPBH4 TaxID=1645914 RepID=UPI0006B6100E|nr:tetratricopeptide repeat protein [Mangrovimonas sp. TPBH4]